LEKILYLFEESRRKVYFLLFLMFLTALFETFEILLIIPLLNVLVNSDNTRIFDILSIFGLENLEMSELLIFIMFIFVLVSIIKSFLNIYKTYFQSSLVNNIRFKWRHTFFTRYLFSEYKFVDNDSHGSMLHNLSSETGKTGKLLLLLCDNIFYIAMSLFMIISIFIVNLKLSVLIISVLGVFFYLFNHFTKNKLIENGKEVLSSSQELNTLADESLSLIKQVKFYLMEQKISDKYYEKGLRNTNLIVKQELIKSLPTNFIYIIFSLFLFLYVFYNVSVLSVSISELIPELTFLLISFARVAKSINVVFQNKMTINTLIPSLNLVYKVLKENDKIEKFNNGDDIKRINTSITFENVTFSYHNKNIFNNITFEIPQKKVTLIHGSSGSGKTSIISLITRLYVPQHGAIKANNKNINSFSLNEWRDKFAVVSQEPVLFNMSIKENLFFGMPAITNDELNNALRLSHSLEFIQDKKEGIDYMVGNKGMSLSGGQRQRLSIAKAILKKPNIYIFDEPTSALDNESEEFILQTIKELAKTTTVIIISHNEKTQEIADKTIYINELNDCI